MTVQGRDWAIPLWLRLALPGVVLGGLAVKTLAPVHDPDTWWHIRSGDELARTWAFAGPDPWGTFATREWIRHEWLMDLVFGRAQAFGGLPVVAWLLPAMAVMAVGTLYAAARLTSSILVSLLVTVVAVLAMSGSLSLRPQVVSFGFAALTTGAWLASARDLRSRWWLLGVTWVWACCHGFWVFGPVIGAMTVAGLALARRDARAVLRLALIPVLSVAAGAVTPVGPRLLAAPFQVSTVTAYIEEWQRSAVKDPTFLAGLALVALPVVLWLARRGAVDPVAVPLLVLALMLVVLSRRTVGLGACIAAPVAASAVQARLSLRRERVTRTEVGVVGGLALLGLVGAAVLAPAVARMPEGVPVALSPRLAALPSGSVVCNAYDAGSWLLWAHPSLKPVIDGRTEVYSVTQVRDFLRFASAAPTWTTYADARRCKAVLVRVGSPLAAALPRATGWTVTETAGGWVLAEHFGTGAP